MKDVIIHKIRKGGIVIPTWLACRSLTCSQCTGLGITVVKGTFVVAHDGSEDKTELKAGGFAYMPAKMIHEAWTGNEGATYFITVDGKWDVNFVK